MASIRTGSLFRPRRRILIVARVSMSNTLFRLQTYVPAEFFFAAAALGVLIFVSFPSEELGPPANAAAISTATPMRDPFKDLDLEAKAAFVYDASARRALFAKNGEESLPIASITKVMTALTALSLIPETTYITIGEQAIREEGDSGFRAGERWLLRDLLTLTLIESSNDGAAAVSEAVGGMFTVGTDTPEAGRLAFIGKMNERAEALNLRTARFWNESGLDLDQERPGAVASAEDTARLLAFALEAFPSVFKETRLNELQVGNGNGEKHAARNTNKNADAFPLLMASKTGYTDLAGGNLVIAFDAGFNHPVVISVLGSTPEGRFLDAEKLLWATLKYLSRR